jgi:hypothetical protein
MSLNSGSDPAHRTTFSSAVLVSKSTSSVVLILFDIDGFAADFGVLGLVPI